MLLKNNVQRFLCKHMIHSSWEHTWTWNYWPYGNFMSNLVETFQAFSKATAPFHRGISSKLSVMILDVITVCRQGDKNPLFTSFESKITVEQISFFSWRREYI